MSLHQPDFFSKPAPETPKEPAETPEAGETPETQPESPYAADLDKELTPQEWENPIDTETVFNDALSSLSEKDKTDLDKEGNVIDLDEYRKRNKPKENN